LEQGGGQLHFSKATLLGEKSFAGIHKEEVRRSAAQKSLVAGTIKEEQQGQGPRRSGLKARHELSLGGVDYPRADRRPMLKNGQGRVCGQRTLWS